MTSPIDDPSLPPRTVTSNARSDGSARIGDLVPSSVSREPEIVCEPGPDELSRLYAALDLVTSHTNPRTARLLAAGAKRMAQKLVEEAAEVALEASHRHARATVRESADLLYHLVVLWRECGIAPDEIWSEMRQRAVRFGIAEKLTKSEPDASDLTTSSRP